MKQRTSACIAVALLLAAFPVTLHADHDQHWVDNTPGGTDVIFGTTALHGIDFDFDGVVDVQLFLTQVGPFNVQRSGPLDDSGLFPGLRPTDGHLDVIDTEMVSLVMTGSGITMHVGAGTGNGGSLLPSLGAIAEQPGDSTLAESFFDVFFEIDLGGGNFLYNHDPLRLETVIHEVPPLGEDYFYLGTGLELWTDPLGGDLFGQMVIAVHSVPAPGAALLGMLGLGLVGWVKRRFA